VALLWDFVQQLKAQTTRGQFRKRAGRIFLGLRLRGGQDVHRQLLEMAATASRPASEGGLTVVRGTAQRVGSA
jgi:hypothetical protein